MMTPEPPDPIRFSLQDILLLMVTAAVLFSAYSGKGSETAMYFGTWIVFAVVLFQFLFWLRSQYFSTKWWDGILLLGISILCGYTFGIANDFLLQLVQATEYSRSDSVPLIGNPPYHVPMGVGVGVVVGTVVGLIPLLFPRLNRN